jgi:hypothetical protein
VPEIAGSIALASRPDNDSLLTAADPSTSGDIHCETGR